MLDCDTCYGKDAGGGGVLFKTIRQGKCNLNRDLKAAREGFMPVPRASYFLSREKRKFQLHPGHG